MMNDKERDTVLQWLAAADYYAGTVLNDTSDKAKQQAAALENLEAWLASKGVIVQSFQDYLHNQPPTHIKMNAAAEMIRHKWAFDGWAMYVSGEAKRYLKLMAKADDIKTLWDE